MSSSDSASNGHKVERTLREAWLRDCNWARETLISRGEISPMFVIHARAGGVVPITVKWSEPEEKQKSLHFVTTFAVAVDAVGVSWMGEAWIVIDPGAGDFRPSLSSKRKECIVVSMMGRSAEGDDLSFIKVSEIIRDRKGRVTGAKELKMPGDGNDIAGTFAQLLPKRTPSADERRAAIDMLAMMGVDLPSDDGFGFPPQTKPFH